MSADIHADLALYLLGRHDRAARRRFEEHLAACARCRAEMEELRDLAEALTEVGDWPEPPPELERRTIAAVMRAAGKRAPSGDGRQTARAAREPWRFRWPRLGLAAVAPLVLAAAFATGLLVGGDEEPPPSPSEPGELELRATLTGPGVRAASVTVRKLGIGRTIAFQSDELPILPKGEFYELWFVGAGDSPQRPNRISAGTFHPDEQGRSRVDFTAAVDPKVYPALAVTREPGDGDPAATRPDVLSSRRR